jgi:hypothetical protein
VFLYQISSWMYSSFYRMQGIAVHLTWRMTHAPAHDLRPLRGTHKTILKRFRIPSCDPENTNESNKIVAKSMSIRFVRRERLERRFSGEKTPRLESGTMEADAPGRCTGLENCLLSISITDGTCSSDKKWHRHPTSSTRTLFAAA